MSAAHHSAAIVACELERRRTQERVSWMYPGYGIFNRALYPKHIAFFAAGAQYRERAMVAANRVGKTWGIGAFEMVLHLTGRYPDWWTGRRFGRPVNCWAAGDTRQTTRDIIQHALLGPPEAHGTGMIPALSITGTVPMSGVPNAVELIYVRHVSGGTSVVGLKSFDQGRKSFQGTHKDVVWLDEECPLDIYGESLIRTADTDDGNGAGMVMVTFTPLSGLTPVVLQFLPGGGVPAGNVTEDGRFAIGAGWDDVPHLGEEEKRELLQSTPPYLREARSKGLPQMGSGLIYPIPEESILVDPFEIPPYWPRAFGMDVGWRVTAAVWGAWDRDTKTLYLSSEYKGTEQPPAVHAAAIRSRGEWIAGVIDPASQGRSQTDGTRLIEEYRSAGLDVSPALNPVEAGIFAVYSDLTEGRIKVFRTLQSWLQEFRLYRRDNKGKGRIVKCDDHLMDAMRYLRMSGEAIARIDKRKYHQPSWRDRLKNMQRQQGASPMAA